MLKTPELIIADTSCLIVLDKIGCLDLLQKVYNRVTITPEIADEFGDKLPNWISIDKALNLDKQHILQKDLDLGEASAIALALDKPNCILIVDDLKARNVAKFFNLKITGTLGVIVKAKETGVLKVVKPTVSKLVKTDFRVSLKVLAHLSEKTGEDLLNI
ncbi:MAG: DUF3368 domain-containing protein [Cyclobacteriaceae bacterium]